MWTPLIAGTVAPFAGRHSIFTTAAVGNDGAKKMTTIGNVVEFPIGQLAPAKDIVPLRKS
jgi:hypothetical protein